MTKKKLEKKIQELETKVYRLQNDMEYLIKVKRDFPLTHFRYPWNDSNKIWCGPSNDSTGVANGLEKD